MARFIVRARDAEKTLDLDQEAVTIGRSEDNDIRVAEPESSRHHCRILRTPEGWRVIDIGSRNGTIVNGVRVQAKLLEPGDAISIGQTSVYYERLPLGMTGDTAENTAIRVDDPDPPTHPGGGATSPAPTPSPAPAAPADFAETAPLAPIRTPEIGMNELEKYRRLLEINKAITRELDLDKLLERVLDAAIAVTGAERGFLLLTDRGELKMKCSRNVDKETVKRAEGKVSKSVLREVVTRGVALRIDDAGRDGRFNTADSVIDLNLAAILAAPLKTRDGVIGAIYLDNRFRPGTWTDAHLGLLDVVADQAAVAVENARLFRENLARQEALVRAQRELEELNAALKVKVESQSIELVEARSLLEERRREYKLKFNYDAMVTRSPKMLEIFAILDRVTDSTVPVLIQGESGTGKELIARALHFNGPRKSKQFVSQNCAAIPGSLMESEFFGHVRGAFTGAEREKPGLFEMADGGTIFLDEIGDMDLDMQTKLLRVLQGGELRRVGAKEFKKVDVRVVSATNRDLQQFIKTGRFREDLYYRLNVINVHLPPLRDRREDVPILVSTFLEKARKRAGKDSPAREISEEAMRLLTRHHWPGNIRELENEVERMYALSTDKIGPEHLSPAVIESRGGVPTPASLPGGTSAQAMESLELRELVQRETEAVERRAIAEALRRTKWKKTEAASLLGISRPTLDAKIEKYQLTREPVAGAP